MMRFASFTLFLAAITTPTVAVAQGIGFGVAPHVSTMGLGADVGVSVHPRVTIRAGGNFFPVDLDATASDTDFTIDLPSPQFLAVIDLFLAGPLRVSGGAMISTADIEAVGVFVGTVDVGGTVYTGSDVGNLTGAIVNKDFAPYAGVGIGNIARGRVGLLVDLGVAFHGSPTVTLTADGPIASNPQFQADLNAEIADFEDEISQFKVYPVVSLGLSFGF